MDTSIYVFFGRPLGIYGWVWICSVLSDVDINKASGLSQGMSFFQIFFGGSPHVTIFELEVFTKHPGRSLNFGPTSPKIARKRLILPQTSQMPFKLQIVDTWSDGKTCSLWHFVHGGNIDGILEEMLWFFRNQYISISKIWILIFPYLSKMFGYSYFLGQRKNAKPWF